MLFDEFQNGSHNSEQNDFSYSETSLCSGLYNGVSLKSNSLVRKCSSGIDFSNS